MKKKGYHTQNESHKNTIYGKQALDFIKQYYDTQKLDNIKNEYIAKDTLEDIALSSDKKPLISVIIPTYNRKDMLLRAVESVLMQKYSNIEIIIINDCSTDETKNYLDELSTNIQIVRVINNSINMNAGYNRNLGFREAKGDYVVFLDDDDYYIDNNFFSKAINIHNSYGDLAFVAANAFIEEKQNKKLIVSNINMTGIIKKDQYLKGFQINLKKPLSTFTSVFNKKILDNLDFENMKMMNDSSIYLRSLLVLDAYIMNDIIGVYVIHESNISKGLNTDFIIMNLEEKSWVFNEALKRNLSIEKSWLSKQIVSTIGYFIRGSKPSTNNIICLLKWINENLKYYKFMTSYKIVNIYAKQTLKTYLINGN